VSETEFRNVTVTIADVTPREAYDALCQALASIESITGTSCEFTTDTYVERDDKTESLEKDTSELWPDQ
jgi:hypothetical protein